MGKLVTINESEYLSLKKKAAIADDVLIQLDRSAEDIKNGKIKEFKH